MKKIFGLILSAAVLGTVLTACGGSGAGVSSSGAAGASEPASASGSAVNSSVYGTTLADIQAKGELVIGLDDRLKAEKQRRSAKPGSARISSSKAKM